MRIFISLKAMLIGKEIVLKKYIEQAILEAFKSLG